MKFVGMWHLNQNFLLYRRVLTHFTNTPIERLPLTHVRMLVSTVSLVKKFKRANKT